MSIHAAATELMETESWDMAAVYFAGIDHFSHRFMRYHARKRSRSVTTDPALFRDFVTNAYRYHDLMRFTSTSIPMSSRITWSGRGAGQESSI
jgi:hypothetical protein